MSEQSSKAHFSNFKRGLVSCAIWVDFGGLIKSDLPLKFGANWPLKAARARLTSRTENTEVRIMVLVSDVNMGERL